MKVIADDAVQLPVVKDFTAVEQVLKACRRFEDAKSPRIVEQFS